MALDVGSRLGHYDVTALIGEGGMGQVYQATDTKLNRQVALKILPEAFATDLDRLARFQREARVLASLPYTLVHTTTEKAPDRLTAMTQPLTVPQVIDTLAVPHGTDPLLRVAAHRPGRADTLRRCARHQEVGLESAQCWTDHPF